ncbi:DUF3515 domain-containing protein [Corynebacterium aquatimens]|uniref:DUF3515 domain-containing protein n=1 Tax=Corynebacterium aquatimens TaxID=1190508 RepID=A0A931GVM9_9CORY|nr:DUF3515 domain-containing protein [Corynebacterium aquatimens]MBG6121456.1 hypothetical protein [Corynebacterium aquatimens]WJY66000.1 hypothetical protein CAQUA_06480 [Corynebacterium aquatimens]
MSTATDDSPGSHNDDALTTPAAGATAASGIGTRAVALMIALSLLLVIGVLVGAKILTNRIQDQPVSLAELPAPLADSPECMEVVERAPEKLGGFDRARIAEPVPAGAAAWRTSSGQRAITLRCGVDMPLQYTTLSDVETHGDTQWIRITEGSDASALTTWFTVNRSPIVAVTAEADTGDSAASPVAELDLSFLPESAAEPRGIPLNAVEDEPGQRDACRAFLASMPASLDGGYKRVDSPVAGALHPETTAAWTRPGHNPVVVRCGVATPKSYAPGAQLTQINNVAWFEDNAASDMPGSTVLYALREETDSPAQRPVIAVSWPSDAGNGGLTTISDALAKQQN